MLKKGTKLYSILKGTCPKCQNESMYVSKKLYNPKYTLKMYERCSVCDIKYQIEPSFFYGAMYVSYGLGVAISIATYLCTLLFSMSLAMRFLCIVISLVFLMPVIMRFSRNIWINIFVAYKMTD